MEKKMEVLCRGYIEIIERKWKLLCRGSTWVI